MIFDVWKSGVLVGKWEDCRTVCRTNFGDFGIFGVGGVDGTHMGAGWNIGHL